MPANSLLGQRAILVELIAIALYDFSQADTYAACQQIPAGGTTLGLPVEPGPADYYAFADVDNSCSAASPIIVTAPAGFTIGGSGQTTLTLTQPGAAGIAVFDPHTMNWFVFLSSGTGGGGGGSADLLGLYTTANGAVAAGHAVKISAADTAAKAQASAAGNAAIGVVKSLLSPTSAEVCYAGEVAGFVGLVPGSTYYLDPATAGAITTVAPTAAGQIVQKIGTAKDATTLVVFPSRPIQL